MTFPFDPRLKERAEEAAKNFSHDLPLTVNDQVLSFLNFFQTPRGRAIVETGLRRAGRYREMISRVLREEGLPQDLIYLAQAESAFPPPELWRAGARGVWRFVAYRAPAGSMNARIPRRPRTPRRSIFATSTSFTATGTWRWPLTTAAPATSRRASSAPVTPISGSSTSAMCSRAKRKTM